MKLLYPSLLLLFSLATPTQAQIPVTIREESDDVDGITATITPDSDGGRVTVEMTAARQTYLAFGFSLDNLMADTLVVAGLPDAGTVLKYEATSYNTPAASASQTLEDVSISQNETHTTMKFTKIAEEEGEPTVVLDGSNIFLYAIGTSNAFGYHGVANKGSFTLDLAGGEVEIQEVRSFQGLWMAHGLLMGISWAILIPIGVGVSVFRSFIPGEQGTWFTIHRALNGTGLAMMLIGFIIAFYIIQQSGGGNHFSAQIPHRLTGLLISLFGIVQGLWGFFRPHAPHAPKEGEEGHAEEKSQARVAFEYGHRILGVALLAVAWYNTSVGLDLFSARFESRDLSLAMWIVVAIIAVVTLGLGVKQRL